RGIFPTTRETHPRRARLTSLNSHISLEKRWKRLWHSRCPFSAAIGLTTPSHSKERNMTARLSIRFAVSGLVALSICGVVIAASPASDARVPVKLSSGRVSLAGTSNIHDYSASTTNVRIVRFELAEGVSGPNFWDEIVKPGAIESFEVAIAARS